MQLRYHGAPAAPRLGPGCQPGPNTNRNATASEENTNGINDEKNGAMFKKYAALAAEQDGIIFGGRLAEYKYYDMHQVIGSALVKAKRELENNA